MFLSYKVTYALLPYYSALLLDSRMGIKPILSTISNRFLATIKLCDLKPKLMFKVFLNDWLLSGQIDTNNLGSKSKTIFRSRPCIFSLKLKPCKMYNDVGWKIV